VDEVTYVVAEVEVSPTSHPVRLDVVATVALDTGSETDPPASADSPEVVEVRSIDRAVIGKGPSVVIMPEHPRRLIALIRPATDAVTRVRFAGAVHDGRHVRELA
jgi:hypothetical protein